MPVRWPGVCKNLSAVPGQRPVRRPGVWKQTCLRSRSRILTDLSVGPSWRSRGSREPVCGTDCGGPGVDQEFRAKLITLDLGDQISRALSDNITRCPELQTLEITFD